MLNKKYALITFLLALTLLCLAFITSTNGIAYAEEESTPIAHINELDLSKYISETLNDKSAGSIGEEKTAKEYLSPFMEACGLDKFSGENYWTQFTLGINSFSYNVVGIKKSATETNKTIVLGAHYDNNYSKTNAMGALNNATGVVCLMGIMKALKDKTFDYNIIYCFYGASNNSYSGSENFYGSLDAKIKKNLLLAINFDSIGCGEYTYFYAGDSANSFTKVFNLSNYNIDSTPRYSKTDYVLSNKRMAYHSAGLNSDNVTYFRNGVRNINFFSGNLNGMVAGFKESSSHENIADTKRDNLDTFISYYPNYNKQLNNVASSVVCALTSENFIAELEASNTQVDFSFLNKKVIIFFSGIIGRLLLCGIKNKTNKKIKKDK